MKRKASETQDSSHLILGDSLLTVSEGVSGKIPKLTSLTALFSVNGSEYLSTSTASYPGGAHPSPGVPTDGQGGALPFLRLWPWTRENPHLRDATQPRDAGFIPVLAC